MSGKIRGQVKRFDEPRGYGFLTLADGTDVFVHYSAIQIGAGFKTLLPGEIVLFDIEQMPDGRTKAVNVELAPIGEGVKA